jgi:demethylmenaquinone methyltransferase/2-methoxy-6-polyprenyl-1,4-benzoquinol methylase
MLLTKNFMPTATEIKELFNGIAKRYDITNCLVSFGLDAYWRHRTAFRVLTKTKKLTYVLDLATGSGKLAFTLRKQLPDKSVIIGLDFSENMLKLAKEAQTRNFNANSNLWFQLGTCEQLPFKNNSIDAITIAFGIRNLIDRPKALKEIYRVLKKPDGKLWILEFSTPHRLLKPLCFVYLKFWVPLIGGLLTRKFASYTYLDRSIKKFPSQLEMCQELKEIGFRGVSFENLSGGIVALHSAEV